MRYADQYGLFSVSEAFSSASSAVSDAWNYVTGGSSEDGGRSLSGDVSSAYNSFSSSLSSCFSRQPSQSEQLLSFLNNGELGTGFYGALNRMELMQEFHLEGLDDGKMMAQCDEVIGSYTNPDTLSEQVGLLLPNSVPVKAGAAMVAALPRVFKGVAAKPTTSLAQKGYNIVKLGSEKAIKSARNVFNLLQNEGKLNVFNKKASQMSSYGKDKIRILRGWAKSKGWVKFSQSGRPETWGVYNQHINTYEWRLKVKPEASPRVGHSGSNVARFAVRLNRGEYKDIFTGKRVSAEIGQHFPLE